MNSFRISIIALSVALIFLAGSSATATTNYSHPQFTVTEDSTLSLRETGSKIVIETIEDAIRQGGLMLFEEGFRIDSSLNWVFGETIEGEADAVVPLWNRGSHVVFAQPGFVFWTGLEEEERVDGNLGVVYRTMADNGVVGGISLFYDHDFQIGHSRLGIGVDAQSGSFHGAFNYYHPFSDTQDGRDGYVEDALQGMDINLAIENNITRLGSNVGYWKFQGDEDKEVRDDWGFSYGVDAGVRIIPGVFLEGSLQRHDKDVSLGQRAKVGLALRFSLPGFEGKSYGGVGNPSDLYKIVEREKRILYEEREDGPTVSFTLREGEIVEEGGTVNVEILLDEALEEGATLNLIGSGSATYNDDYTVSGCNTVTGTSCPITGNSIEITINDDGRGEDAETIILSVLISSGDATVMARGSLVLTIPEDPPLRTVSLSADSTSITEGGMATITLTLSEVLENDVTLNLVIDASSTAIYGTSATSDDWHLSVGGTNCSSATESSPCRVIIPGGMTSVEVSVVANTDVDDEPDETAIVTAEIDSGSLNILAQSSSLRENFTIMNAAPPTVTLRSSFRGAGEGSTLTIRVALSRSLSEAVTLNLVEDASSTATYGISDDWHLSVGGTNCNSANGTDCQVMIPAGESGADVIMHVLSDSSTETGEQAIVSIRVASGRSTRLVQTASPSSVTINIVD